MSKLYHYRFTGAAEEHFPEPPIAWTLEPGDEMILDEPVEHARLQLVEADPEAPAEAGEPEPAPSPAPVEIAEPEKQDVAPEPAAETAAAPEASPA